MSYLEIRPSARKKTHSFTEASLMQCRILWSKRVSYGCILRQTRWARREHSIDTTFNVVGLLHHVLISISFLFSIEMASSSNTLFFCNGKSEAHGFYLSADVLFFIQISCDRLRSRVESCIAGIYGSIFIVFTRRVNQSKLRRRKVRRPDH